MKVRHDIPPPQISAGRTPWGTHTAIFRQLTHGQSFHTSDWREAESFKACFIRWRRDNQTDLKMSRRRVGADDPDGAGWRFFFLNPAQSDQQKRDADASSMWGGDDV